MTRRIAATLAVVVVLTGTACSSSSQQASTTTSTTVGGPTDDPAYAKPGPYKVGYTTLRMTDRDVAVWYPADDAAVTGMKKATYDQATPLPKALKGLVPPKYNTVVTMDAYKDAPASVKGPFPVVLFSHGVSAYRLVNSALDVGIASWGFVVVSADYLERGLVAQIEGKLDGDPARDRRLMLQSLDLVQHESERAGSVLLGIVNASSAGAVGHSAGGGTAFDALSDERVNVAIGWAPVGPSIAPVAKPTMIIGASDDIALTPRQLAKTYASFPSPKRRVEIGNAGHNTFTDVCTVIRRGGGLIEFARQNHLVAENLLEFGLNGCRKRDTDPKEFWPVVQHFTVAELRSVLLDAPPVGLGDGITRAFPHLTTYTHRP
jgi:predicted dienelactone hydrolase